MKRLIVLLTATMAFGLTVSPGTAAERYRQRPPVTVSTSQSDPWVTQLGAPKRQQMRVQRRQVLRNPAAVQVQPSTRRVTRPAGTGIFSLFQVEVDPSDVQVQPRRRVARTAPGTVTVMPQDRIRTAALMAPTKKEIRPQIDPVFLPQEVDYSGVGKPGDIVIDSTDKFLYLVQSDGTARRYGVGVGKEGFGWTGTETITNKKVWPEWRPPAEMIVRERAKGRILPALMEGGEANPLGARALYLGDTLYRIHGTNAPWTIGTNVSSGCIRLRNEDISDLYDRVDVGTKVIVM
jgi:lipoprotein-anchoring transpeptidase ErfK/SrfK